MPQLKRMHENASQSSNKRPAPRNGLVDWTVKRYRNVDDEEFLWVEFPRSSGERASILVPMDVGMNVSRLSNELLKKGAALDPKKSSREGLVSSMISRIPNGAGTLAYATGWHGRSFLFGPELIRGGDEDIVLSSGSAALNLRLSSRSGSVTKWKSEVAGPAVCSSYASFAIMHAFSAPLYQFVAESKHPISEGAIFNFSAPSSVGKTTALKAGASVSGDPASLPDWNATVRGLQERAAAHSHIQLILNDTETMRVERDPLKTLRDVTHYLVSGKSTDYAASVRVQLPTLSWVCWAISTSPKRIDDIFAARKQQRTGSDRVRLIDIPVPEAHEGGIWDRADEEGEGILMAVSSESLAAACLANHGHALRDWLNYVVDNQDAVARRVEKLIELFIKRVCSDAGDVERRTARKFGLVYAAGRIANDRDFFPWPKNHPFKVAKTLFERAMGAAGEDRTLFLADLKNILRASSKDVRYPLIESDKEPEFATADTLRGFRRNSPKGLRLYVRAEVLKALCAADYRSILERLDEIGALEPGEGGKTGKQVRVVIGGEQQRPRLLVLNLDALQAEVARNPASRRPEDRI